MTPHRTTSRKVESLERLGRTALMWLGEPI
jgi:hypothetical protein